MATTKKGKSGAKAGAKKASKAAKKAGGSAAKAKKAAPKKSAPKKSSSASKAAAPKKSTSVRLNDRQREYLQKVQAAGETGYQVGPSSEQRTIDALVERKLVKRGSKDKASGKHRYHMTKAGAKHLTPTVPSSPPATP
jgi:hypothetical protein